MCLSSNRAVLFVQVFLAFWPRQMLFKLDAVWMMFKLDSQKSFTSVYLAALQVWEEISSNSTGSELDGQIWTSTGLITMEEWVREGESPLWT